MVTQQGDIGLVETEPTTEDSIATDGNLPSSSVLAPTKEPATRSEPPTDGEVQAPSSNGMSEDGMAQDYKALYERSQTENVKLKSDSKSVAVNARKQRERDEALDNMQQDISSVLTLRPYIEALIQHASNADATPEELQANKVAIDQKVIAQTTQSEFQRHVSLLENWVLEKADTAEIDLTQTDVYKDSRLANALMVWNTAKSSGNVVNTQRASLDFERAIQAVKRENDAAALKTREQEEINERRKAGDLAIDTGKGTFGSNDNPDQKIARMANSAARRGGGLTPDELKEAKRQGIIR